MLTYLLPFAASLALATPALADEFRAELRGGVWWAPGVHKGTIGVAAGRDFNVAGLLFVGVEGSADKILTSGSKVSFGASGRAGANVTPWDKLYLAAGYSTKPCDLCEGAASVGAGWEHKIFFGLYGKLEYRHFIGHNGQSDANAGVAGVGVKF